MKTITLFLSIFLGCQILTADPTQERVWTSTAKSTITGKALSLDGQQVSFETSDGRKLKVPLNKLVPDDQAILKKHFAGKLTTPPELVAPAGLPFPQGSVEGPIDTGTGSKYYLYLPKSLSAGYEAPLFFWTGSGPSKEGTLNPFIEGAELTGMILAASVESSNNNKGPLSNVQHSGNCLKHIEETLPVKPGRIFFSGSSGGGATGFLNADNYKCAGVFAYVAYMPGGKSSKYGDYAYAAGGAFDFNRYLSAYAAKSYGEKGTHRLYPGGHKTDRKEVPTEGICWLYSRELYDNSKGRDEEQQRFEFRFNKYLQENLKSQKPHLAYYWCDHLLNSCEVQGPFASILEGMSGELATANQRYLDGRKALNKFSEDYYAELGAGGGSKMKHTTPKIQAAAEKLANEFSDVIEIGDTARELGNATAKP